MRNAGVIILALRFMFLLGCASRYQTFTLLEGVKSEQGSTSIAPVASPANSDPLEESQKKDETKYKIKRRVLVDRKTGNLYYFEDMRGPLLTISKNK